MIIETIDICIKKYYHSTKQTIMIINIMINKGNILKKLPLTLLGTALASNMLLASENAELESLKKEVQELREITQSLIDETSDLKTGFSYTVADKDKTYSGLGAAASKVYYSKSPLSIGGYGEMYFANAVEEDGSAKTTLDIYRFIPYIGYKFSDNIILNTEIEFEHGGAKTGNDGYVILEFMYLDFLINKNFNVRAGNFLVPVGLISERHEPTLFTTVQRPNTAKYLIPTTWNESGIMAYGSITDNLTYKLAAVSALQTQTNGDKWLRDGRGGTFKQTDAALAFVGRLDYNGINGLLVGGSLYSAPARNGVDSNLLMAELHFNYQNNGLRAYGTYTKTTRSNAQKIAADAVESARGGYINLSYDLLALTSSSKSLPVFIQYESINPQEQKADGTSAYFRKTTTLGINYFPHEQVVLKADYAIQDYGNSDSNTASISMGFIF